MVRWSQSLLEDAAADDPALVVVVALAVLDRARL
jgi:hypothetical protein